MECLGDSKRKGKWVSSLLGLGVYTRKGSRVCFPLRIKDRVWSKASVSGEKLVLFHNLTKIGLLMPGSAKICLKLLFWNMFGIWLFSGIIRCLEPKTKLREWLTVLLPPGSRDIASVAYSRNKIWNISKWELEEKWQRWTVSKMESPQFPTSEGMYILLEDYFANINGLTFIF